MSNRAQRRQQNKVLSKDPQKTISIAFQTTLALTLFTLVFDHNMKKKDVEKVIKEVSKGYKALSSGILEIDKDIIEPIKKKTGVDITEAVKVHR